MNNNCINQFDEISMKLITILDQRVKDVGSKNILETLKNTPGLSNSMFFIKYAYSTY